jgi:integrase
VAVFRLVGLRRNKRTGFWEYRRVPPAHLRPYYDKREFKRSTGTADKREAEGRALPFIAQWKALEEGLAAKHRAATEAAARGDAAPPPLVVPSELPEETLRALAGEAGRAILAKHSANPAPHPEATSRNDSMPPSAPHGEPAPWGTRADPWAGHRFMLLAPKRRGVPASAQGEVTRAAQAALTARGLSLEGAQWEALCYLVREALDGAYATLQRRHRGEGWTDGSFAERFPEGDASGNPRPSITGLITHWRQAKEKPNAKTYDRYGQALASFASFLGHDDATQVQPGDLQRWLIALKEGKASAKKLTAKTINDGYRAGVKACFAAAAEAGALRADPLAGVKFKIKADAAKAPSRLPYDDDDAARLLAAARDQPATLRWLPLLLAYTGARIGEIAQLRREDVRHATPEEARKAGDAVGTVVKPKHRKGVYFLRLTNEGEGQTLKNLSSRREVPLHPAIIEAGFLDFVAKVGAGQYLFPEVTAGKYGNKGDGASRDYRKWARNTVGIVDPRLTAHSWRHRLEDQLRDAGAPEDVRDALTGHASKSMGGRYGRGHSLATKAEWLAKVPTIGRAAPRRSRRSKG